MSLPDVVHRFKSLTTTRYRHGVLQNGWSPFPGRLWQRNYYERVIRNDGELRHIREYILARLRMVQYIWGTGDEQCQDQSYVQRGKSQSMPISLMRAPGLASRICDEGDEKRHASICWLSAISGLRIRKRMPERRGLPDP